MDVDIDVCLMIAIHNNSKLLIVLNTSKAEQQ